MFRRNIDSDAARSARAAANELARLQNAMRSARDSMNGLRRAIAMPTIRQKRQVIKGSVQNMPSLYAFLGNITGDYLANDISEELGKFPQNGLQNNAAYSFYTSFGQAAGSFANGLMRGQRIL